MSSRPENLFDIASCREFNRMVEDDWLTAFLKYSSYGECTPRIMFWVGVSTIASVLQRKVWIDQEEFQWAPNFYILIVGEQGVVRKSTSIDVGLRLAKQVKSVKIGKSSATWSAFIKDLSECVQDVVLPDGTVFRQSCVTQALSEFGTFFKPEDNDQIDGLTDLWDNKLDTFEKITIARGLEAVENPWINLIAATTPKWITRNLTENLVGGGLLSRFIFLHGTMPEIDISYPKRAMPPERTQHRAALVERLRQLSEFSGEVHMTEEAYEWGDVWYKAERNLLRSGVLGGLDYGFRARKQGHLHKLAIVLAAARGHPHTIGVQELKDAAGHLEEMEKDAKEVLGGIGVTRITGKAKDIVKALKKHGKILKYALYREMAPTTSWKEFIEAVECAVQARIIVEAGDSANPLLIMRDQSK